MIDESELLLGHEGINNLDLVRWGSSLLQLYLLFLSSYTSCLYIIVMFICFLCLAFFGLSLVVAVIIYI